MFPTSSRNCKYEAAILSSFNCRGRVEIVRSWRCWMRMPLCDDLCLPVARRGEESLYGGWPMIQQRSELVGKRLVKVTQQPRVSICKCDRLLQMTVDGFHGGDVQKGNPRHVSRRALATMHPSYVNPPPTTPPKLQSCSKLGPCLRPSPCQPRLRHQDIFC